MTDNFTKVPNAILEALIRHRFTGAQYTVLLYVIRKTRGWGKTSDKISVSMIARESGYSRREIINSVRDLEKKKVIKANLVHQAPMVKMVLLAKMVQMVVALSLFSLIIVMAM